MLVLIEAASAARDAPVLRGTVLRAQTNFVPTRIEVKPQGTAVTFEGDVEKGREAHFVFEAKAGLKFTGHLTTKSGKAGFAVDDPDGKGLPEEEFDYNTISRARLKRAGTTKSRSPRSTLGAFTSR